MSTKTPTSVRAQSGKYLTFFLNDECYGARVDDIEEVIAVGGVTPVPQVPPYILGVTNIRGRVVPVVDLRIKFRMPNLQELENDACVVVVHFERDGRKFSLGCVVNRIGEVLNVDARKVETTPTFGSRVDTRYLQGVVRLSETEMALLLDVRNALTAAELEATQEATEKGQLDPAES